MVSFEDNIGQNNSKRREGCANLASSPTNNHIYNDTGVGQMENDLCDS
jgi:hypothetical protein